MCGTNDQIPVRGVPCALGRYLHQRSAGGEPRVLTQHTCDASFLDWVECRCQLSPDLEVDELKTCPMLRCRERFNSISATVDHVKTCPRLQDGWYWCPFCRRPERFLECDGSCEVNRQPLLLRKGSVPSRAADFFNCLGRRDAATEDFQYQANSETERPMCGDFEAEAREAGLDDQLSALNLAGVHGMHGPSVCEFEEFPGVSFAALGDDTNALAGICNRLIPEPSIELPGSRMTFTSHSKLDSGPVLAASEFHQFFDQADPDSDLTAASKPVSRATFPVGVTDTGKEANATSSHWLSSFVSAPVSAVSPHKNVMARGRFSNPPESLVIPNHQQLGRDNKPSIALSTLSTVSSSGNFGSSDAFSSSSYDDSSHNWRKSFYVDEFQEILAVSHKLDRCQGISSSANHWSSASVLADIQPNATPPISPTSPTSSTNFTSTDSSRTSLTNIPISPFSPSFPISNSETTHCSSCPATFTGTPQHRRSNYARHVRTSRRHSAHAAIKCTHCKATLMRTDNLAKHLKHKHNISTPSDRQGRIKRRR